MTPYDNISNAAQCVAWYNSTGALCSLHMERRPEIEKLTVALSILRALP
jgi:hypothetical protein